MDEEGLQDTENKLIHIGKPIEMDEEKFMELVTVPEKKGGNAMIGISYLVGEQAEIVKQRINAHVRNKRYDGKQYILIILMNLE